MEDVLQFISKSKLLLIFCLYFKVDNQTQNELNLKPSTPQSNSVHQQVHDPYLKPSSPHSKISYHCCVCSEIKSFSITCSDFHKLRNQSPISVRFGRSLDWTNIWPQNFRTQDHLVATIRRTKTHASESKHTATILRPRISISHLHRLPITHCPIEHSALYFPPIFSFSALHRSKRWVNYF